MGVRLQEPGFWDAESRNWRIVQSGCENGLRYFELFSEPLRFLEGQEEVVSSYGLGKGCAARAAGIFQAPSGGRLRWGYIYAPRLRSSCLGSVLKLVCPGTQILLFFARGLAEKIDTQNSR